jgi:hypothetical protein
MKFKLQIGNFQGFLRLLGTFFAVDILALENSLNMSQLQPTDVNLDKDSQLYCRRRGLQILLIMLRYLFTVIVI